ncbi:hypothetical protein [Actinoplanes sp. NPDC049599]|uniref:hypothetical protein n=1 Tax=Actinoplanes sp. NPDC049599 TaxID=3363903 RepID=UPI0037BDBB10
MDAPQAFGVAASQAPVAVPLMSAPEFLALGRVIAGSGPVAHPGQFRGREQLELPHGPIVPRPTDNFRSSPALDHADVVDATDSPNSPARMHSWVPPQHDQRSIGVSGSGKKQSIPFPEPSAPDGLPSPTTT